MISLLFLVALTALAAAAQDSAEKQQPFRGPQLKVFLDCEDCFVEFLRSEIEFVDYVRDRGEADVHALITRAETASGGREYRIDLIGSGRFAALTDTLRTTTTNADTDDTIRRQLATALRVGLLRYLTRDTVPAQLEVGVRLGSEQRRPAVIGDRWNNWVFSLRGSASFEGEESTNRREFGASLSVDRITPDWKITFGSELEHEREQFDLDEDTPVTVTRRERDFDWLIVKGLGEHWSAGTSGDIESSTFENTELAIGAAPAIEYNVFPYSMHMRRQLRAMYAVGIRHVWYYEVTLFGEIEETLPQHELSLTFEQRERWGSLDARLEWSQYLHDLSKSRLEADGQVSLRLTRGLSVASQISASRIRDQLSIPARGATPEEILLRLRQLESGYEYDVSFSLTYTFGSIFSSVVNPRFGR